MCDLLQLGGEFSGNGSIELERPDAVALEVRELLWRSRRAGNGDTGLRKATPYRAAGKAGAEDQ